MFLVFGVRLVKGGGDYWRVSLDVSTVRFFLRSAPCRLCRDIVWWAYLMSRLSISWNPVLGLVPETKKPKPKGLEMLPATHELATRTGPFQDPTDLGCVFFLMFFLVDNMLALNTSTKINPACLNGSPTIQYQNYKDLGWTLFAI